MKYTVSLLSLTTLAFFTLTNSASAAPLTQLSMNDIAASYVSIQEALAQDDFETAQKQAKALQSQIAQFEGAEKKALESSLAAVLKAADLKSTRAAFKKLSPSLVSWAETTKPKGYIVVYCPMAGASWIQKDGDIQNPYFGREMLQCGEKKS